MKLIRGLMSILSEKELKERIRLFDELKNYDSLSQKKKVELNGLKKIYLEHTSFIERILENICKLSSLEVLDISKSFLNIIPESIGQLKELKYLDLFGNSLKQLPNEIGQLTKLEHLSLGGNGLESLPAEIGNLTNLKHIDLRWNQLRYLPSSIEKLTDTTFSLYFNFFNQVSIKTDKWNEYLVLTPRAVIRRPDYEQYHHKLTLIEDLGISEKELEGLIIGNNPDWSINIFYSHFSNQKRYYSNKI